MQTTALIITLIIIVCFVTEIFPISITAICACLLLGIFGVCDFPTAFSGFSNDVIFLCIGASIIGTALMETGVALRIGNALIKNVAHSEKLFTAALILVSGVMSMFVANIPVTAMFIPIAFSVAAASKGRISTRKTMITIGISTGVGGISTLVGSTANLAAQGLLIDAGYTGFKVFDFAFVGIPLLILLVVYFLTIGRKILETTINNKTDINAAPIHTDELKAGDPKKQLMSIAILILCVIGFLTQIWTIGTVALAGGMLLIITKCISLKDAYKNMQWDSIFLLAGSLGFAKGLSVSGISQLFADGMGKILGINTIPIVYVFVLTFVCMILTNLLANTTVMIIFVPIAISLATTIGISVYPLVMAVMFGSSMAFATPIGCCSMTLIFEPGGYSVKDLLKVGGPYCIIGCILISILIPLFQAF